MKTKLLGLLAWLAVAPLHAQNTNGVLHLTLDSNAVCRVPVALDRVTTIILPGPIVWLEGAFISQEPSMLARFQLSYQPGSHYFSLRAMDTNVTANLNVILGREVYALELTESRQPAYVITLARPAPGRPAALPAAPPKPARLTATFETARNYARLLTENPEAAKAIQYARPNQTSDGAEYAVRLEEAFRFEEDDTLILRLAVRNKTRAALPWLPAKSGVRVGHREFLACRFEGNATLPVGAEVEIYLAITGDANGGRNNLAVTNSLAVFLGRPEPVAPVTKPITAKPAPPSTQWQGLPQPGAQRPTASQSVRTDFSPFDSDYRNADPWRPARRTGGIHLSFSIGMPRFSRVRQTPASE